MMPVSYFHKSSKCVFPNFYNVYLHALKNYNFNFDFTENILISFDDVAREGGIRKSLDCSMKSENVAHLTSYIVNKIDFIDQVYHFPSSDYNYGFVSINNNNRVKVSFNPNLLGIIELQEIFIVNIDNNEYKWYQYDFSKKYFVRNDDKCLRCHERMKENFYRFNEKDYIKIKN